MQFVEGHYHETFGTGQRTLHLKLVERGMQHAMRKHVLDTLGTALIDVSGQCRVPLGKGLGGEERIGIQRRRGFYQRELVEILPDVISRALMQQQGRVIMHIEVGEIAVGDLGLMRLYGELPHPILGQGDALVRQRT